MFAQHCRTTSLRIALTCVVIAQLFAALPVRAAPLNTFAPVPYTLTLQLDASTGIDTYIYSGSKNTNYGSVIETGIGEENTSSNQVARSLIKFDLSSIPSNATITAATLSLWTGKDLSSYTRTIRVYRLKTSFQEAQATWNEPSTGVSWQTAGASGTNDRENTDIGSVTVLGPETLNIEKQIALTPGKIQEMINGNFANQGFIIVADTELNDRFHYKTSDSVPSNQRPRLVIQYTMPGAEPTHTLTSTPTSTVTQTQTPSATYTETPTQSPSPTNPPYHISLPLNLNNEAGDFSQYTSFETDGGDLTVSPQAGLAGTGYGLSVLVDDSNRAFAYSALETPSITGVIRARFYVDPNGLGMEELSQVSFIFFISSGASNAFATMKLMRIKGDYYLRGVMVDDNEVHQETEAWQVTDEPHYVEIRVRRSSGAEAEDATYETWIDGVARTTMTGVDSYEKFVDFEDVSAGLNGIAGSVSGTYYIDEIAVNDDGSEIGPVDELNPTQTPSDVPPTHPYYKDIEILYANGYTAGCNTNPLRFCPDQIMNRAESAVFMMRGAFGAGYSPNPTANLFEDSDWSRGTWARPWTEAMREAGMTAGCKLAPLLYCPWVPLSREQVVVFALRMKYGNTYAPPAGTGSVFEDVEDPNNWSTPWIEKAYADGLIRDCGTANSGKPLFCPANLVSRGLAAYMIVRAKDLSMP